MVILMVADRNTDSGISHFFGCILDIEQLMKLQSVQVCSTVTVKVKTEVEGSL